MNVVASSAAGERTNSALAALGLGAFVIGSSELVIVGVLLALADSAGVSVSTAGLLVTSYALGVAIGGPVATMLSLRLSRRTALSSALSCYVAVNALTAATSSFGVLMIARFAAGSMHGLYLGAASSMASALVPVERRGRAISMVFGGIAVSTVVGVPLGTVVGQTFGWRATFASIVVLGAIAVVAMLVVVPGTDEADQAGALAVGAQIRAALAPRVLAMLVVGLLIVGGQFTALTYLALFLAQVSGVTGGLLSGFLFAYGAASAIGTFVGGRLADRDATKTLISATAILVLALMLLYATGSMPALALFAIAMWGIAGFGLVPALQLRVMGLAGVGANLAGTLGASAVNAGIAIGAFIGGQAVGARGAQAAVAEAAVILLIALPAVWGTRALRAPVIEAHTSDQSTEAYEQQLPPVIAAACRTTSKPVQTAPLRVD